MHSLSRPSRVFLCSFLACVWCSLFRCFLQQQLIRATCARAHAACVLPPALTSVQTHHSHRQTVQPSLFLLLSCSSNSFLRMPLFCFLCWGHPSHTPLSLSLISFARSLCLSLCLSFPIPPLSLCTLGDARGGFDGVAFSLSLCLSLCLSSSQGGSGTVQTRVFHRATLRTSLPGRGLGGTTLVASEHTTRPAQVYFPKVTNDHK